MRRVSAHCGGCSDWRAHLCECLLLSCRLAGGGNWEFEGYTNNRSVSFVKNSSLVIRPTLLADAIGSAAVANGFDMNIWGGDPSSYCTDNAFYGCERTSGAGGNVLNPVQSAALRTASTFTFKYGRVEVSAKLPKGDWFWPAIWIMPAAGQYGNWPASGEIDIMESRGNDASYAAGGCNQFSSTLHWGPDWNEDQYTKTHASYTAPAGTDLTQGFHTYGLFWNASLIQTYIDDPVNGVVLSVPINTSFWSLGNFSANRDNPWVDASPAAPFDQRFYLIINLAVGGTNGYFPDGVGNKPWTDTSPNAMDSFWGAVNTWYPTWTSPFLIDSVKVWQTTGAEDYAYAPML